jgi:hypothetical protein
MNKSICTTIRQQLDEMILGEPHGLDISRHLSECTECRDFHHKQTKLRQIVGSLGTVNAPPDFDFRLRSRLARDNSSGSYHMTRSFSLFGPKTATVAASIVIIVGTVVVVRQFQNRTANPTVAETKAPQSTAVQSVQAGANQSPKAGQQTASAAFEKGKERLPKRNFSVPTRNNRFLVAEDQSSSRAPVVRAQQQASESVFPIDASQQSLRVSLFDGRGNPRTISLPTVTFGSQRVVPTATSFAPKGVW